MVTDALLGVNPRLTRLRKPLHEDRALEDSLRITGSYTLPFHREKAYHNLHDPSVLSKCVPGCDELEKVGEDEYAMKMKMVVDGFSGFFSGKIKISEANPPQSFKMLVEGSGTLGSVKGEGLMSLSSASANATELAYDGDVLVGGAITGAGQRMIHSTAKMMIGKFFERFTEEVKSRQ